MPRANRPNFVSVSKSNWRLSNCARDAIWLQRKSIEADIEYVPRPRPWTPPCWTHWLRLKTPIMAPFFAARDRQPAADSPESAFSICCNRRWLPTIAQEFILQLMTMLGLWKYLSVIAMKARFGADGYALAKCRVREEIVISVVQNRPARFLRGRIPLAEPSLCTAAGIRPSSPVSRQLLCIGQGRDSKS